MLSPQSIKEYLDEYVMGQEGAKRIIANTMFLHACRVNYMLDNKSLPRREKHIAVNNLLVMGPSGCGKTYLIEKASEYLKIPVFKINAKSLSNAGYVGTSIEEYLSRCAKEGGTSPFGDFSIVIVDEFDKLCLDTEDDGWYHQIQYSLLKYVEGIVTQHVSKASHGGESTINTMNYLFVFAGNFEPIRKKRKQRKIKVPLGFCTDPAEQEELPFQQELIDHGVVRELMGRISNVVEIDELTEKDYISILQNAKNSCLESYNKIFQYVADLDIDIPKKDIKKLAKKCKELKVGARGLQALLDEYFADKVAGLSLPHSPQELLESYTKKPGPDRNYLLSLKDCEERPILIIRQIDTSE